MIVRAGGKPQLGEDVLDVLLDGGLGDPQRPGDSDVRLSLGHQGQHLTLAVTQYGQRVVPTPRVQQLHDQRWVDHRAALHDPSERVDKLVDVGDPTLE